MGASWRSLAAPVLLLVLAAALAPLPAQAGSAADPEVTDPAGDEAVDDGALPILPGVNEEDFGDVDIVGAFVTEFGNVTRITVQTTNGWTTGSLVMSFRVGPGPTSLPGSTASGSAFTVYVNGTTVAGVNGTAATTTDGLRIDLLTARLGATGGDLLTGLSLNTSRTDPGNLQGVTQDDQTGTDMAGPGRGYTFARPPVAGHIRIALLGGTIGGQAFTGSRYDGAWNQGDDATLQVQLTNDGLDDDQVNILISIAGTAPVDLTASVFGPYSVAAGATTITALPLRVAEDLPSGNMTVTIAAESTLGGTDHATLRVVVPGAPAPPPTDREVKPAGLTFLTSGAEAVGFDDAFGSYGEAVLLALIVLLVILALFLLMALGRGTTRGEPAAEAPSPRGLAMPAALAGPGGVAETVRGKPVASKPVDAAAKDAATGDDEELADFGALMAAAGEGGDEPAPEPKPVTAAMPVQTAAAPMRIRIEEVRHAPREPEAGQVVRTEVILRNDGPSATLRIALSVDGKATAERTVQVPSRATKAVELPWTAGAGDNRVRIQAFPA